MKTQKKGFGFRPRVWLMLALLLVVLSVTMGVAATPQNYRIGAGDIASETIFAAREVVDEEATAQQKQAARDVVGQVYSVDMALTADIRSRFAAFLAAVDATRQLAAGMLKPHLDNFQAQGGGAAPTYLSALSDDQWRTIDAQWPVSMDRQALNRCLMMDETAYQSAVADATALYDRALGDGVTEARLDDIAQTLNAGIDDLSAPQEAKSLIRAGIEESFEANAFFDSAATEAQRQRAADAVAEVVYQKGQAIVRVGEVVTQRHIEMLRNMGMLAGGIAWPVYAGVFLGAFVAVGALFAYLCTDAPLARDMRKLTMVCIVLYCVVLMGALMQRFDLHLVPVGFAAIVLGLTVNGMCGVAVGCIAAFACTATALAAGIEAMTALTFLISGGLSSIIAAFAVARYSTRSGIVGVGIVAGAAGAVVQMIAGLLTYANMEQTVIRMGVSLVSGLLSGVLCLGTTPVWENIFKALTPMKLMELCNPTNALLKRLMFEAPGTYHHSVMVGNLAEAAAEAIGANGLLARVGAYYHDVGKLSAPMYFSENQQPGHNPHDALAPLESARIILRHPHDGAAYLREQGIAQPIIDIALEHHGDTPVGYFLNAAKERGESVDAREFCYTGGKPTSAEAAIVMLADCCEAATRACAPNGDYRAVMNKIVRKRMEDGQFDRVDMTFAELGTVVDTFESVLRGAYHSRVQYPDGAVAAVGEGEGR